MTLPTFSEITSQTLKDLQARLELNNEAMAALLGISVKTWQNRISANKEENRKLLSKLEYEYLKDLALGTKKHTGATRSEEE